MRALPCSMWGPGPAISPSAGSLPCTAPLHLCARSSAALNGCLLCFSQQKEAHQQVMLQGHQGVGICESVPVGVSRGTVPGPLALQPLPDLLVASATGRASGSACRARHALRQPSAPSTAQYERFIYLVETCFCT